MSFNSIARHYDKLSRLVFGESLMRAQLYFLNRIDPSSNVLVMGGGTGWWLKEFLLKRPECNVCYVEKSVEMLKLAKAVCGDDQRISYRLGTEDSIIERNEFDAVITFCFLDVFSEVELGGVIEKIKLSAKADADWLVTDFINTRIWHSILLFVMYRFFRVTTSLKIQQLPNWEDLLLRSNLIEIEQKLFYGGFIKSAIFKRK
ncbi:MAG: class I SAM-dependent methyltransferase [Bacteroidia bacterium]|nr:class I SAM-dependent methyltransferase [Bacteroidia bacterium]